MAKCGSRLLKKNEANASVLTCLGMLLVSFGEAVNDKKIGEAKKDKINFNRFLFVGFKLLKLLLRDIRGP